MGLDTSLPLSNNLQLSPATLAKLTPSEKKQILHSGLSKDSTSLQSTGNPLKDYQNMRDQQTQQMNQTVAQKIQEQSKNSASQGV